MSPLIERLLNEAKRDAFTYELRDDGTFSPMRAKSWTTPLKAFLIMRMIDRMEW